MPAAAPETLVAQPLGAMPVAGAPRLTDARCELLREIQILDEYGDRRSIHIPAERPLTIFVDKRELVTLMTLGGDMDAAALTVFVQDLDLTQQFAACVGQPRRARHGHGAKWLCN